MLIDLENIVGIKGYYIDDVTHEIWSYKRKKPVKMKLNPDANGYIRVHISDKENRKSIKYHQIIVKLFVDPNYNSNTQQIDHLDHNKLNNSIENLRVVSKSENTMNKTVYNGKQAVYIDNIGESISVNNEHGIYYSKTYDSFYRYINHAKNYRQLHEYKDGLCMWTLYKHNKKSYNINCTKFRQSHSK